MRLAFFFLLLIISSAIFAAERPLVTIYSYHQKPPLIIDKSREQGLYYEVCRYLNQHSDKYSFEMVSVPRKRIERMLESQQLNGVLLGVSPIWFKDMEETKYLWSSRIFTDRDEVISLAEAPVSYSDHNSLQGKIFGGVRGFYYYGINELVSEKKIARVDTANELDLFDMLLAKRIDSAVVSRSTYEYVINKNDWHGVFYLSNKPHDIFDRRILVPKQYQTIYDHISPLIDQLQYDKNWKSRITQYQ